MKLSTIYERLVQIYDHFLFCTLELETARGHESSELWFCPNTCFQHSILLWLLLKRWREKGKGKRVKDGFQSSRILSKQLAVCKLMLSESPSTEVLYSPVVNNAPTFLWYLTIYLLGFFREWITLASFNTARSLALEGVMRNFTALLQNEDNNKAAMMRAIKFSQKSISWARSKVSFVRY